MVLCGVPLLITTFINFLIGANGKPGSPRNEMNIKTLSIAIKLKKKNKTIHENRNKKKDRRERFFSDKNPSLALCPSLSLSH